MRKAARAAFFLFKCFAPKRWRLSRLQFVSARAAIATDEAGQGEIWPVSCAGDIVDAAALAGCRKCKIRGTRRENQLDLGLVTDGLVFFLNQEVVCPRHICLRVSRSPHSLKRLAVHFCGLSRPQARGSLWDRFSEHQMQL